jgi:predicted nucleotidyltransferase
MSRPCGLQGVPLSKRVRVASELSHRLDILVRTAYSRGVLGSVTIHDKHQVWGNHSVKAGPQKRRTRTRSAAKESKPIDLPRLATILGDIESIKFAMLFGSARDGIVCAGSDLDVAVSLAEPDTENIDVLLQIVGRVEEALGITCDLTVLNTAGPVLRHEALKGRILFVRPDREDDFVEFYVRTCAEYEDLMASYTRQLAYRGYSCPSTV